ncbi:Conserved_hypothetical protein [Hexamita inflata]|uniref:Uncharacterized protein n=1 Tax=Hexamita inflata TaxID=28002 RepID=A0AA86NRJ3_9EUKA|nr:Conserved hypothetical protein [Hexamita inflata]
MNIKSDEQVMLQGCEIPICSFSLTALFGCPGCGKTYQMQKMEEAVIEQSKKTTYDLDNPFLCNGPITHRIYISPSINSDRTLKKEHDKILIDGDENKNIINLCDTIKEMVNFVNIVLELQVHLRNFCKENKFTNNRTEEGRTRGDDLIIFEYMHTIIKQIEKTKKDYPELKFKETNIQIKNNLTKLYQILGLTFDGYLIRRNKIIMLIDDCSGTSLFTNILENKFYKTLCKRRHLGIFFTAISFHSLGNTFYSFKTQMNAMLFFTGMKIDKVKAVFDDLTGLESPTFGEKQFVQMYKDTIGFQEEGTNKQKYIHNFLYILIRPTQSIRLGFDKVLK